MSLLCAETDRDIEYGDVLMAGTRSDGKVYYALSREALGRIPESEKRPTPCGPGEGGINIHSGTSTRIFNGSYTWSGFRHGPFRYSISKECAERYLPKLSKMYPAS